MGESSDKPERARGVGRARLGAWLGAWAALLLASPAAWGQCSARESAALMPGDAQAFDTFGQAVDVSGEVALIGAPGEDDIQINSGAVYLFEADPGGRWTQTLRLKASDPVASARFGSAVAIDGTTLVVGAPGDTRLGAGSGSARVFEQIGGTWVQTATLLATDGGEMDSLGLSVSVSGDTIIAGAYFDDDMGLDAGAAYVFVRDAGGWVQQGKLLAADGAAEDWFGWSVSIDGDWAVVGAFQDDDDGERSGSAYVFHRSGTTWSQFAKLNASDARGSDQFGVSVSISGQTLVVGSWRDDDFGDASGSAYVFERLGSVWLERSKLLPDVGAPHDVFGRSVAIDGDLILVGANGADAAGVDSGAAYVYQRQGGEWAQQARLIAGDTAGGDQLGVSTAVDAGTLALGAWLKSAADTSAGAAYLFDAGCRCPADIDGDGDADVADFFAFVTAFATGDPAADLDGDGSIDVGDFFAFVAAFAVGCG